MAKETRNVLLILLANIIGGGLLISLFDSIPIIEGQYLAFITSLTVGYGDLSPETWPARIVSICIGINGLLLTGIVVAMAIKAVELSFSEEDPNILRHLDVEDQTTAPQSSSDE
ncbi:potassium channel family protein [Oceaniferula marina]|nr:potassium channel family protein [Oceaniferula marina]